MNKYNNILNYKDFKFFFENVLHETSIKITNKQTEKFYLLYKIYKEERKKFNFTSLVDDKEIIIKQFLDSIILTKYINYNKCNFLDLGPGGGFPSMPIAIIKPNINLTLVERKTKFAKYLKILSNKLNLSNIIIYNNQIQELKNNKSLLNKFDIITARAVGDIKKICKLIYNFLSKNGIYIAQKSKNYIKELKNLKNCQITDIKKYTLPLFLIERYLIFLKKK